MFWTHSGSTALAAFLASLVEAIEALTVILAVGTMRGWRDALLGAAAALVFLAGIVAALGPALTIIPLAVMQCVVGVRLLLLFGLRWLRKAVLRAAGALPLHDETTVFRKEQQRLAGVPCVAAWDNVVCLCHELPNHHARGRGSRLHRTRLWRGRSGTA